MKSFDKIVFAGTILVACLCAFVLVTRPAAARVHNPVVSFDLDQLEPALANAVEHSEMPVVIEFYDALDSDTSAECKRQLAEDVDRYSAKVTMLRAEVHAQSREFIDSARVVVCPTHLFVLQKNGRAVVAQRVWGYLSDTDFQQLFNEFFAI